MPAPGKSRKKKTNKQKQKVFEQQKLVQRLFDEAKAILKKSKHI